MAVLFLGFEFYGIYYFNQKFLYGFSTVYNIQQSLKKLSDLENHILNQAKLVDDLFVENSNWEEINKIVAADTISMEGMLSQLSEILSGNKETSDKFKSLTESINKTQTSFETIFARFSQKNIFEAQSQSYVAKQYLQESTEAIDGLRVLFRERIDTLYNSLYPTRYQTIYAGLTLLIICGLLLGSLGVWLVHRINISLDNIAHFTDRLISADFNLRAPILYHDEIGRVTHMFNKMAEALKQTTVSRKLLEEKNRELEQFAYVASHDLQEPLRMIASFTSLLAQRYNGKLGADADEYINFAVDGAKRMQLLINDLLQYSRLDSQGREFESIELSKALDVAKQNLKIAIEESGVQFHVDKLPKIKGDLVQLCSLFQNLIGNAIKFRGKKQPLIKIICTAANGNWTLGIKDNGIGIESQYFERIFQIFQRLHKREEYPGTGIGLSVCKKIVERHGGKIWIESEPNQGTTVWFTLPKIKLEVVWQQTG